MPHVTVMAAPRGIATQKGGDHVTAPFTRTRGTLRRVAEVVSVAGFDGEMRLT